MRRGDVDRCTDRSHFLLGIHRAIMMPMAKKKTHKKQVFKYAQPTAGVEVVGKSSVATSPYVATKGTGAVVTSTLDVNPYLGRDLIRLAIIATSLIVVELGLWSLFSHTAVGMTIYNLYKIRS